jgi:nucleoside-diphosphate-sugar epimerase
VKVMVAGAGGVVGQPLVRLLVAAGHEVTALTHSPSKRALLRQAGAEPVICDALDETAMGSAVQAARPEVIVNELTALPPRIHPRRIGRGLAPTNQLRTEGARILMAAAARAGVGQVVAQSVAFAYAPGSARAAESDPLYAGAPGAFAHAVRAVEVLEQATLRSPFIRGAVLRYGFFYGPGTSFAADGSIAADVRRRRFPIVGTGSGVFSFVHVLDAARATAAAIEQHAGGTYNIVDDEPASVANWLPVYARMLGAPAPPRLPAWLARVFAGPYGIYLMTNMPGASNDHAKTVFGWQPQHRSWRDGWLNDLAAR